MGSWNSGFKEIAEMMPTAFRRDVAAIGPAAPTCRPIAHNKQTPLPA
jgi:hypothetical protein